MWDAQWELLPFIARAGFQAWNQIQNIELDWSLITALVERWRPETHTFHFVGGEVTVTLQDVGLISGLPVDGEVISGSEENAQYWHALCVRLLGDVPDLDTKSPTMAKRSWFKAHMQTVPHGASNEVLLRYARAYILVMLGSTLMPDTSGDRISLIYLPLLEDLDRCRHYSWGAAVLAQLYRHLCAACLGTKKQIGGCMVLLQLWSWERIHVGRPMTTEFAQLPSSGHLQEDYRGSWSYW